MLVRTKQRSADASAGCRSVGNAITRAALIRRLRLVHLDHAVRLGVGLARDCRFGAPAATADLLRVSRSRDAS